MLHSLVKDLQRFTIRATDGDIGRVDHFLFDDREWALRYIVVDTGVWLPGRRVLVSPRAIVRVDLDAGVVELNLTQQKVRESPDIETDVPVSRQKEIDFHDYYGYPYYWGYVGGPGSWAAWSHPPGAIAPPLPDDSARPTGTEQPRGDPHLRSTKEVTGYAIQATDGEMGHVKDFIAEAPAWTIRYLVVSTGGWIGGRDVLLSRDWVTLVDWDESKVHINVTRQQVKDSPEYDRTSLNRAQEEAVYRHYDREGYWEDER